MEATPSPDGPLSHPLELAVDVHFGPDGLVPVIAQEARTNEVLMLAWMDGEALRRTVESGQATYWSRSRQEYWVKGATSGHTQKVVSVDLDCDGDAVLLRVHQTGPACHTGSETCFTDRPIWHAGRTSAGSGSDGTRLTRA